MKFQRALKNLPNSPFRLCEGKNEFKSVMDMQEGLSLQRGHLDEWHFSMVTREPVDRFLSGYALLMLYRACGDEEWLQRARCFALMILDSNIRAAQRTPDSPFSLFEGLSGALCFLVDLLPENIEKAQFPLYPVPF
ncbi:hypothetical protein OSTOST_25792 [Ostertagia ostertagi]